MNTEQLIAALSADVPRVPRHALAKRIAIGVVAGSLAAMLLVAAVLGIRPDLEIAMKGFPFWMKWAYSLSLGAGRARRLRAAGAAAGLGAGAWAATIYCLHCPEASALFVLTWYSLGILLATAIGALVGPRFLRW